MTSPARMTPSDLRDALALLRWSQRGLAEALECDDRLIRRWASGDAAIPDQVAEWLSCLSQTHRACPPPRAWRSRKPQ
jgi:hypothetical protein